MLLNIIMIWIWSRDTMYIDMVETKDMTRINYFRFYTQNVLHHSLLFLCILIFQYLKNLEKWSDQAQNFQRKFSVPITVVSVKDR